MNKENEKENKKKKYLLILALIWCILSFLIIVSTYSKYISTLNADANIGISTWTILVNNQDISQNSDFSQTLSLKVDEDDYYIEDALVPGATGYFEIEVDSSEVSLPYRYTITADVNQDSDIKDLELVGYSVNNSSMISLQNVNPKRVQATANASVNTLTIKVYVMWNDDDSETEMNDVADTEVAVEEGSALLDVNVLFEQIEN